MALTKSDKGLHAFKTRSNELSVRQRSAFIMFDGKRSASEVLAATATLGVTAEDIVSLIKAGMVTDSTPQASFDKTVAFTNASASKDSEKTVSSQDRYQRAYLIATQLTAGLGLRGFRLNLAVESANSYEKLLELAPKIREAVGEEKFKDLGLALSE